MNIITPRELKEWIDANKDFTLIDVREDFERQYYNIGGMHIPMGEILERKNEIPMQQPVVMYCEKGIRSAIVIQRLEAMGYTHLYNLTGGMKGWKQEGL